ncbi:hypothetical protein G7Y79_00007g022130 [Physcia stellaris]|nr:hypothetical protein G7Y79_00007g022130 [Physcia stellaris]
MDDSSPLASFSLTHVHYNANDPVSYLCAWLALVPQALCVIYATLIWSSREAEIVLMGLGQFGCEVLNFALKRLIKEQRPPQMNGKGYGMPSSHAQFTAYFSVSLSLFLLLRHTPLPASPSHTPFSIPQRLFLSFIALVCAAVVAWSRIYLNYHNPLQVFVGVSAGVVSAVGWFGVTEFLRRKGWVQWGLDTWVARELRMRDLVVEEDLVAPGWERWERKRRDMKGGKGGVRDIQKKKR